MVKKSTIKEDLTEFLKKNVSKRIEVYTCTGIWGGTLRNTYTVQKCTTRDVKKLYNRLLGKTTKTNAERLSVKFNGKSLTLEIRDTYGYHMNVRHHLTKEHQ